MSLPRRILFAQEYQLYIDKDIFIAKNLKDKDTGEVISIEGIGDFSNLLKIV